MIAQSFAGWPYLAVGGPVKTEEDALDPEPPTPQRQTMAAIGYMEQSVVLHVDDAAAATVAAVDGALGGSITWPTTSLRPWPSGCPR